MSQSSGYPATTYIPGILSPSGIKDIKLKMVIPSEVMQKVIVVFCVLQQQSFSLNLNKDKIRTVFEDDNRIL